MTSARLIGSTALLTMVVAANACAADPPSALWQGFYIGGHVGGLSATTTFSDPEGGGVFGGSVNSPGFLMGAQLGYNWALAPQWVAGVEADASIVSSQGRNTCLQSSVTVVGSDCRVFPREIATLTGRLGYVLEPAGRTMIYGRAGVAWMRSQISVNPNNASSSGFALTGDPATVGDPVSTSNSAWGWTIGAGVEYAFTPGWSLDVGYQYLRFNAGNTTTPETVNITTAGHVTTLDSGGISSITQDVHLARVGLSYHFGVDETAKLAAYGDPARGGNSWRPDWEFQGGARYWYSSGNFTSSNGTPVALVSRLPYTALEGHSGEVFARLDSPFNVFLKGFVGGGVVARGTMYDEDWGLSFPLASEPSGYEITRSSVNGSFSYLTADIGYNVLRGPDHKVGFFVGYNRYQTVLNTQGCEQMVNPASGVCSPTIATETNAITEVDTWHSLRVGTVADVEVLDRVRLGVDLAYLPYVYVDALDIHRLRSLTFPASGTGNGVQGEIILSYQATNSLSVGIGGRYWAMWTANAYMNDASSYFTFETQRYGLFVQAAYKFNTP